MTASNGKADRRNRERLGHASEYFAAALLVAKGYRILARRFSTTSGEIDLVVCRGRRLAFIEVKRRRTLIACQSAVTQHQRHRIRRAADLWLARHPHYRDHEIAFDTVFLTGPGWPRHYVDAL